MKNSFLIYLAIICPQFLFSQNLEVEGKARVTEMDLMNSADSVVVVLPDGTLARRDAGTLNEFQVLSISNDTIYLSGGGFVKLPGDDNAGWNTNVDTTSTSKYVGIGTTNPAREFHVVGDQELTGNFFTSGNISLLNALDFADWDFYGDANGFTLSEKNVAPRLVILPGGHMGIGTTAPDTTLHVVGSIKMVDGNEGTGKVLTSDANGLSSWQEPERYGLGEVLNESNNAGDTTIANLRDPVNAQDAATKNYVDQMSEMMLNAGLNGIVKDIDGNVYKTIKIGDQVWMADNLRTTRFNEGTIIPKVNDNTAWSNLNTPAYSWYNNDSLNAKIYGAMYNYYTVEDTNSLNVCPSGWDVPTDADWTVLADFLELYGYGFGGSGSDIGKSMAATFLWNSNGTAGTVGNDLGSNNSSGFSGLPGGERWENGVSLQKGDIASFWGSTEDNANAANAWTRFLNKLGNNFGRYSINKKRGHSVRCVKD